MVFHKELRVNVMGIVTIVTQNRLTTASVMWYKRKCCGSMVTCSYNFFLIITARCSAFVIFGKATN
jgi:hypothetical protein